MSDHGTWPNRLAALEHDLKAFRSHYYRHTGINAAEKMNTIVILEKKTGSHFANLGNRRAIAEYIRTEFPSYQVEIVAWSEYSITEQVQLLSRTRAMITLPGADAMNGVFLRDGGILIMYCRIMYVEKRQFDPNAEIKNWFSRISHIRTFSEACNSTNVEYSVNGSSSETNLVNLHSLKETLTSAGLAPRSQ